MSLLSGISDDIGYIKNEYFDRYFLKAYNVYGDKQVRDSSTDIPNYTRMRNDLADWKDNQFGLFTPYKSKKDFVISLALPFVAPIALSIISTISAILTSIAFSLTIISFALAGVGAVGSAVGLFKNKDFRDSSFELAILAANCTAFCMGLSLISGLLTWVAAPLTTASLLTRTGSTLLAKDAPEPAHGMGHC